MPGINGPATHNDVPAPLTPDPSPPTEDQLFNSLYERAMYEMKKLIGQPPHYEHSMYGTYNTFLQTIFPYERDYVIIPQALLRPLMDVDLVSESLGNISITSDGVVVPNRHTAGRERGQLFPDFQVVKNVPTGPKNEREHFIVCTLELKRDEDTAGTLQMTGYMQAVIDRPHREEDSVGFLIDGSRYRRYFIANDPEFPRPRVNFGPAIILDVDDKFVRELCELSVRHWDRKDVNR